MNIENKNRAMSSPLISIVIPTLNRSNLVLKALDSALQQQHADLIEIIVVDNASTDDTWSMLQQRTSFNVKLIRNPTKLNICENWQSAFDVSTGQYVLILGDDDYLFPHWASHVIDVIKKNEQPSFIAWNHITYIESNPISGWRNLLVAARIFSLKNTFIDGGCLRNTYLRLLSEPSFSVSPHPSLFLFNRQQVERVSRKFNTKWFEGLYPDYHAAVLAGEFDKQGIFVDRPLVCVGGVEARYYCRTQSKMESFISNNAQVLMQDLGDGFGLWSPYLAMNIARQLIYSCQKINYALDKNALLDQLIGETVENIWFCDCVFGKGSHLPDLTLLEKKFGKTRIDALLNNAKNKTRHAKINKFINKIFGQKLNILVRDLLGGGVKYAAGQPLHGINNAVAFYLQDCERKYGESAL